MDIYKDLSNPASKEFEKRAGPRHKRTQEHGFRGQNRNRSNNSSSIRKN